MNNKKESEYKAFNLKREYNGYTGEEKYAIATDLPEEELRRKYGTKLKKYEPFIVVTWAVGEVFTESASNETKDRIRVAQGALVYASEYIDEFGRDNTSIAACNLRDRNESILEALNGLKKVQRDRVIAKVVYGYSVKEIANMYGCSASAISQDINNGIRKLRTVLDELEVS